VCVRVYDASHAMRAGLVSPSRLAWSRLYFGLNCPIMSNGYGAATALTAFNVAMCAGVRRSVEAASDCCSCSTVEGQRAEGGGRNTARRSIHE
jgi:hypothetical protein